MTTTRLLCAAALLLVAGIVLFGSLRFWPRIAPYLQRRPAPVGADETYAPALAEMQRAENEIDELAAELDLDSLDPDTRPLLEDLHALRLCIAEDVDHFDQRVARILDDFAPGWYAQEPTTALPSFGAVHCLIDDTSEWPVLV